MSEGEGFSVASARSDLVHWRVNELEDTEKDRGVNQTKIADTAAAALSSNLSLIHPYNSYELIFASWFVVREIKSHDRPGFVTQIQKLMNASTRIMYDSTLQGRLYEEYSHSQFVGSTIRKCRMRNLATGEESEFPIGNFRSLDFDKSTELIERFFNGVSRPYCRPLSASFGTVDFVLPKENPLVIGNHSLDATHGISLKKLTEITDALRGTIIDTKNTVAAASSSSSPFANPLDVNFLWILPSRKLFNEFPEQPLKIDNHNKASPAEVIRFAERITLRRFAVWMPVETAPEECMSSESDSEV